MWWEIAVYIFDITWLYRGWAYIFSLEYRAGVQDDWRGMNRFFIGIDILISLLFMTAEIYLAYLVYQNNS